MFASIVNPMRREFGDQQNLPLGFRQDFFHWLLSHLLSILSLLFLNFSIISFVKQCTNSMLLEKSFLDKVLYANSLDRDSKGV